LELFFRDTLTDEYRRLYWEAMAETCTMSEWEGACLRAMGPGGETFHVVPLPAVMQRYIDEVRRETRIREEARRQQQEQELKLLESSTLRQEALLTLEASQAKLAALWGQEWLEHHKRMLDDTNTEKEQRS
jgi:hypothetical protein